MFCISCDDQSSETIEDTQESKFHYTHKSYRQKAPHATHSPPGWSVGKDRKGKGRLRPIDPLLEFTWERQDRYRVNSLRLATSHNLGRF